MNYGKAMLHHNLTEVKREDKLVTEKELLILITQIVCLAVKQCQFDAIIRTRVLLIHKLTLN